MISLFKYYIFKQKSQLHSYFYTKKKHFSCICLILINSWFHYLRILFPNRNFNCTDIFRYIFRPKTHFWRICLKRNATRANKPVNSSILTRTLLLLSDLCIAGIYKSVSCLLIYVWLKRCFGWKLGPSKRLRARKSPISKAGSAKINRTRIGFVYALIPLMRWFTLFDATIN